MQSGGIIWLKEMKENRRVQRGINGVEKNKTHDDWNGDDRRDRGRRTAGDRQTAAGKGGREGRAGPVPPMCFVFGVKGALHPPSAPQARAAPEPPPSPPP